jgi:hypothetical protein
MHTLTLHFETDEELKIYSEIVKYKDEEKFVKDILFKSLTDRSNRKRLTKKEVDDMYADDRFWND